MVYALSSSPLLTSNAKTTDGPAPAVPKRAWVETKTVWPCTATPSGDPGGVGMGASTVVSPRVRASARATTKGERASNRRFMGDLLGGEPTVARADCRPPGWV